MRYWLLTTEYPPFYGGGIGTYCYNTARMMAEKGHDVSVIINDSSINQIQYTAKDHIRIIRFNPNQTRSSSFLGHTTNLSYEFANIVKELILKEGKPDLIEAQEYLGIAYYLLQYKYLLYEWCRDIPVLITMHSPSFLYMEYNHVPMYRYPNFWICEMERFCLQAADYVVSPSQYMISELKKRFALSNKNVLVIPNPFETKKDTAISNHISQDQIVFYGKLTVQKGALKLLEYFKELWENGFEHPLFLLGGQDIVYHPEGLSMGDLIKKTYKKYIQKGLLFLEDKIKPENVAERIACAGVVIIPSNNDNFPYTVLEMMALGKIVLVSKQGGQAEVVKDAVDGFIFDHEQPESFSKQLTRILKLSSPEKENISLRAIEKIRSGYNYEVVYNEKIKLLEKLQRSGVSRESFPLVRTHYKNYEQSNPVKSNDKLSIVIPYFNMGKYIEATLRSVLQSDYSNKEIIIVNDGSDDGDSLSLLDRYRHGEHVRVIDKTNQGIAEARNLGACESTGDFLAFLDADDMVEPAYFSRAIKILQQYENIHFVGSWTQYFDSSNKIWPTFQPEPPIILYHNTVNSSALVYKRNSFLNGGKNDNKMVFPGLEDYESVISLLDKGYNGVMLPETLFHYRVRNDSMIRKISKEKKLYLCQYISGKHQEFYSAFAGEIFNLENANGPGIQIDNPTLDYQLMDKLPFSGRISNHLIRQIKKNRYLRSVAYKIYKTIK